MCLPHSSLCVGLLAALPVGPVRSAGWGVLTSREPAKRPSAWGGLPAQAMRFLYKNSER
jgi:hypothetical protein